MTRIYSFSGSEKYHARARQVIPLGATSSMRATVRPVPLTFERAEGSRIWDIDGNEYIDYVASFGPAFLGHNPAFVAEAVAQQLKSGVTFGGQHPGELALAEKMIQMVPCAEVVSFCNSGTEAVQTALKIARAATGRTSVLQFSGQYHGWIDALDPALSPPSTRVSESSQIVIPWGDRQLLQKTMNDRRGSLAAVLMEPVALNHGAFYPPSDYLELARQLCTADGVVLIFDEVISGFRLAPGGAQQILGVVPDIGTYAKAMGSGYPVAAVAGRREIMAAAMDDGPLRLAGTYNGQALGVAAGNATLDYIACRSESLYPALNAVCDRLHEGLADVIAEAELPITLNRVGSAFQWFYGLAQQPTEYAALAGSDSEAIAKLSELLVCRGVFCLPRGLWFVSAAHSPEDIDETLAAVRDAFSEFKRSG